MHDSIKWSPVVTLSKWDPKTVREITQDLNGGIEPDGSRLAALQEYWGFGPDHVEIYEGNQLVNTGLQRIGDLYTGASSAVFSASRGMTGVGDSTTATTVTMTSLQAATNTWYKALDSAPGSATGVLTGTTTFQTSEANFAWNEWCWAIATAAPVASASFTTATTSGIMVNRKQQALGTKASGAIWSLQATITLS